MANEEEVVAEKKGSKMIPILFGVQTLALLGVVGYLVAGGGNLGGGGGDAAEGAAAKKAEDEVAPDEVGPMFTIKGLVVNLNDPSGDRYLRASMNVELTGEKMLAEFTAREPQIKDQIITFISSLRYAQTQGARGKEEIRKGITSQINDVMRSGKIRGVYFTEFVVQ